MGIAFITVVEVTDAFRDILKRQQYEKFVLKILNRSKKLIKNLPLNHIEKQSDGECDFEDSLGLKYDVKLLLDENQGALIGERKNDLIKWFESMRNEVCEFGDSIKRRDLSYVTSTKLYRVMKKLILSIKEDKIAILFSPYPIVDDIGDSIFQQFATDFLKAIFKQLSADGDINCKGVYYLYPSMENGVFVLRDAESNEREYIEAPELSAYINYLTVPVLD